MRYKANRLLLAVLLLIAMSLLCTACVELGSSDGSGTSPGLSQNALEGLAVHFIDVGQADAMLLVCDGQAMLVDGGNVDDSSTIVTYLKKQGIDYLDYVVCTHAHEDHVGGLSGALNYAQAGQVFSPVTYYDTAAFGNFVKYVEKQGLSLCVPECGMEFMLGEAKVQVVGPVYEYEETNDTSICLRVSYGDISFLFTGDAESTAESDMIDAGYDLSANVMKAGHHGSNTSNSYVFLREVMPEYVVISVGEDNSYGHPHEEPLSRFRDVGATVYRTDMQGDIVCTTDGVNIHFFTAANADAVTNPTSEQSQYDGVCIGNVNSQKFHRESCDNLPAEQNRKYFDSRTEALSAGYEPCGNCQP